MRLHFEQADARYYDGRQSIDSWIEDLAADLDDGFAAWHWAAEHDLDSALSLAACIDMAMVNAPGSRRKGLWNTTMQWFDHASVTTAVRERRIGISNALFPSSWHPEHGRTGAEHSARRA